MQDLYIETIRIVKGFIFPNFLVQAIVIQTIWYWYEGIELEWNRKLRVLKMTHIPLQLIFDKDAK